MTDQLIQGSTPDSQNELNLAQALDHYKMEYIFQYSILGGKGVRGGLVIDFLVIKAPLPVPVQIQGSYWHSATMSKYEPFEVAQIEEYAKYAGWDRLLELSEAETSTYEAALMAVKQKVGVA
jgi:hypothetical protein